jgi:hypothetical protein
MCLKYAPFHGSQREVENTHEVGINNSATPSDGA